MGVSGVSPVGDGVSSGGYYVPVPPGMGGDPTRQQDRGAVGGSASHLTPAPTPAFGPGAVPGPVVGAGSVSGVEARPSGAEGWGVGLVMLLVFIPGFNVLLAAVAMMVVGLWGKDAREPGRTNRRRAASWGLTLLLVEICLLVIQIVVTSIVAHYRGWAPFNPWGAPIMVALAMVVVHVLVCAVQGIRSYRGRTVRFGGIPFFR